MDPQLLCLSSSSLQFFDKRPPSFDVYGDDNQVEENIKLWDALTSISPENGAPTVSGRLIGQASVTAKSISLSTLTSEVGLMKVIEEMDMKLGCGHVTLLQNNVATFFHFSWEKEMQVQEFVTGFHSSHDKISKLNNIDELKGHILLRQANLDSHDRNIIITSSGGTTHCRPFPRVREMPIGQKDFLPRP